LSELADAQPSPSHSSADNDKTEALIELPVKAELPPVASPKPEVYATAPPPVPPAMPRPVAVAQQLPPSKEEQPRPPRRSLHPAISAGIGGGVVALAGLLFAFLFMRGGKPAPPTEPQPPSVDLEALLKAAKDDIASAPSRGDAAPMRDAPDVPLAADALFEKASPAVVRILIRDRNGRAVSSGSGFFVRTNLIATNYHVVAKAHSAQVVTAGKSEATVLGAAAVNQEADLAIIKVTAVGEPLELAGSDLPRVGTKVYAIGNPLGRFTNTISDGIVSQHREAGALAEFPRMPMMIQTTAAISHGSSGGPLLVPDGKVVGVTTLGYDEGQNINLAVPASQVAGLLRQCEGEAKLIAFPLEQPNALTYLRLGYLWLSKKEYDKAIGEFDEAIRLDPKSAVALNGRGMAWSGKNEHDKAIRDFSAAIGIDSQNARYYGNRGFAWYGKKDYDKAIIDFNEAIRLDSKYTDVLSKARNVAWTAKLLEIKRQLRLGPMTGAELDRIMGARHDTLESLTANTYMAEFKRKSRGPASIIRYFRVEGAGGTYRVNVLFENLGDGKGPQLTAWNFNEPN
jgi:S1-C subfamily serine protease